MTFKESIQSVYRTNYANFRGRASRSEFWWVALFNTLTLVCCILFMHLMYYMLNESGLIISLVFYALFLLLALVPGLAVTVRRLHDANYSGWWALICFIPWLGTICLLAYMLLPSSNKSRFQPKDYRLNESTSRTSTTFGSAKIKYLILCAFMSLLLTFSISAFDANKATLREAQIQNNEDTSDNTITNLIKATRKTIEETNYINDSVKRLEEKLDNTTIRDINRRYGSTNMFELDSGIGENERIIDREAARAKAQGKWHQIGNMLARSLLTENCLSVINLLSFGDYNKRIREIRSTFCDEIAPIHKDERGGAFDEWGWYMENLPSHFATIPIPVPGYWKIQYISVSIEAIKSSM